MKKLMDIDIADIVPYSRGIIVARKDVTKSGEEKIRHFTYDVKLEKADISTQSAYLLNKFGENYEAISENLDNRELCSAAVMPNKHTAVVFSSGELGLFDEKGKLYWTGKLEYRNSPVCGVAVQGKYLWFAVPEANCVVRYSPLTEKIVLRIGGDSSTAFLNPVSIVNYDDILYICNYSSCKIRTIDLSDFTVSDYKEFDEPVYKYIRTNEREIVELESGVYML